MPAPPWIVSSAVTQTVGGANRVIAGPARDEIIAGSTGERIVARHFRRSDRSRRHH